MPVLRVQTRCDAYWDRRMDVDASDWPIDVRGRVVRQKRFAAGTTRLRSTAPTTEHGIESLDWRAVRYPTLGGNREGSFSPCTICVGKRRLRRFPARPLTAMYLVAAVAEKHQRGSDSRMSEAENSNPVPVLRMRRFRFGFVAQNYNVVLALDVNEPRLNVQSKSRARDACVCDLATTNGRI